MTTFGAQRRRRLSHIFPRLGDGRIICWRNGAMVRADKYTCTAKCVSPALLAVSIFASDDAKSGGSTAKTEHHDQEEHTHTFIRLVSRTSARNLVDNCVRSRLQEIVSC